jgi:hypothetical protein
MAKLVSVYKVPELKMVFFIFSDLDKSEQHHIRSQDFHKGMEGTEGIEIYREYVWPNTPEQWTGSPISVQDFLVMIEKMLPTETNRPSQASTDLDKISLLTIEALKPHFPLPDPYYNLKHLTYVPEDDMIEVFI